MPMNLVIQEKRKELGLTQEQIAQYLNVSTPAVSKWEKGSTSPDISLLPSLARLLKVDLNTLFCFQEDISQQEIGYFCKEVTKIVQEKGFAAGFEAVEQKIHEYPYNEILLQCLTMHLDGLLTMSGLQDDAADPYDVMLIKWYHYLAKSSDSKIKNSANFMLASKFIREGNYEKAQEILDSMPDKEDVVSGMADKMMLQVNLYLSQGKIDNAVKDLQYAFLMAVNKVQMLLHKMFEAELSDGKIGIAKSIADKESQMAALFDLWEYNSFLAPLEIAVIEKDADECICLLRKMFASMADPWDMENSPLFYRIAKASDPKQMLSAILSGLEKDSAYAFLQNHEEFKELISEYRALAEK